jgi:hypothetical protein
MKLKQEDLYLLTAMELGLPQEQVEYIVKNSFNLLRHTMTKCRGKNILLNEFVRFSFKKEKWEKFLINSKNKKLRDNEEETITQNND